MNDKKHGLLETSVLMVKAVLCLMIVFLSFLFIRYGLIDQNGAGEENKEAVRFIKSWTVTDSEGKNTITKRYYVTDKDYNKNVTIHAVLPRDIKANEYLIFDTRKDVAVYIDGELRTDFVESRDVNIPGGSVTRFYMTAPLSESDSGADIKMVLKAAVKDEQIVPNTFITTRYGAFCYLMESGQGLSLFLTSLVHLFSIVVIIVSVVLRYYYKLKIDMMYGAFGIFVIASWLITDSPIISFLFGTNYVSGILNYMLCSMIPFAPALYLNSLQRGQYRKSMSAVMIASSVNAIIWPLLHFTGIVPFYNIRNIANVILAAMAVWAIAILIYDAVQGNISKYKYTFIGFFGFLVCCLVELMLVLLAKTNDSLPMVAGLALLLTFVVIQQVHDLRQVNMEKQRAIDISEAKTRFLASMSHEIRTPINAILGMNEMILRENSDKVIDGYSRSIKTSGKMLLMLVNDVLDFSKIEAGKLEISESPFLMSEMLYDVISLVKERADEKKLELTTELCAEIPDRIISDEFRIRQILVNLINNAVKYTEKGSVTLILGGEFTDDGFDLYIKVKDTGKGIRKEEQADLFEAFSRADVKSNMNIEGTGLGLAIVKSIVGSMNGTLGVESEFGKGSLFWVKLPVKYESRQPLTDDFMESRGSFDDNEAACSFTAPDAKVLAVDDNQSNLTIVRLFLKRCGIVPDLCDSGSKAAELCREKRYDLLLLDHMMPQPNGIETLHLIRNDKHSLNRNTKAIVLTANAVAGSRKMYLEEGFEDYLTKPLDSSVLEQTVKNMLPAHKVKHNENNDTMSAPLPHGASHIRERLTSIEGLDYETALGYCGNDEVFLSEVVSDITASCKERCRRMRRCLTDNDLEGYRIEAHTVKSAMATIGLKALSERAKQQEFAAKEGNTDFISREAEDFIRSYEEVCRKMEG